MMNLRHRDVKPIVFNCILSSNILYSSSFIPTGLPNNHSSWREGSCSGITIPEAGTCQISNMPKLRLSSGLRLSGPVQTSSPRNLGIANYPLIQRHVCVNSTWPNLHSYFMIDHFQKDMWVFICIDLCVIYFYHKNCNIGVGTEKVNEDILGWKEEDFINRRKMSENFKISCLSVISAAVKGRSCLDKVNKTTGGWTRNRKISWHSM